MFIGVVLLVFVANHLFAAEMLSVFDVPDSGATLEGDRSYVQAGNVIGRVKYNPDIKDSIAKQSRLSLNLDFLDGPLELDVVSIKSDDSGYSYSAVSPDNMDLFTVAQHNGIMLGSLIHDGKLYKFRPTESSGDTLIIEMPEGVFENAQNLMLASPRRAEVLEGQGAATMLEGTDDGSVINIIVAYTRKFVEDVGGAVNLAAYITQLEEETNLSFQLSGVNTKVDIVYSYPTSYSDSTNFTKDANFFLTDDVAEGRGLRGLRNQYHADIMVVLTGNSGYDTCGYTPMLEANEANALAVIREVCATGYYQFAHEIGHIFGADHNIEEASGLGVDYAHGYCGTEWRSIMSYHCSTGGGRRLPLWSNPDETFNGEVMGVAGVSNNVKVLNDRALEVSNFRFQVATPDQVTLTSPVGIIVTDTTPIYEWESAERATSYRLKVTDNSGNVLFEESYMTDQVCELNVCSVTPTIGLPFGLINWWIVPENATGEGPESEKGIFAVAPVPRVPEVTTLLAPWGVVSDATPAYSWNAVSISSWYRLLARDGDDNLIIDKWYTAADVNCQSGEGECSVTPDAIITKNPVIWWVQTWNNAGYGDWSESRVFYVYPLP